MGTLNQVPDTEGYSTAGTEANVNLEPRRVAAKHEAHRRGALEFVRLKGCRTF